MESIKLTSRVFTNVVPQLGNTGTSTNQSGFQASASNTGIRVYSGPVPTQAQLNTVTATGNLGQLTSMASSIGATMLMTGIYPVNGNTANAYNTMTLNDSPYMSATASGAATWFAMYSIAVGYGTASSETARPYWLFVGTVGPAGSGADLILTDNTIVSGNQYKVGAITLSLPNEVNF